MSHSYDEIISLENLFLAWEEFIVGKRQKNDVQEFSRDLMDNILSLHADLASGQYCHDGYESFFIHDPKKRHIHKASVRDRLLHHAVYRLLYQFFDKTFIADSFSCRNNKGTHKAVNRFRSFANKVSKNHTRTCWVLKGDIRRFFASVDHRILKNILAEYVPDKKILVLLSNIIESYETESGKAVGLPLHSNKVFIKTIGSGVDFLGWTLFPKHRTIRASTKKRAFRRIKENPSQLSLQSYLGLFSHGDTYKIRKELVNWWWIWHESYEGDDEP